MSIIPPRHYRPFIVGGAAAAIALAGYAFAYIYRFHDAEFIQYVVSQPYLATSWIAAARNLDSTTKMVINFSALIVISTIVSGSLEQLLYHMRLKARTGYKFFLKYLSRDPAFTPKSVNALEQADIELKRMKAAFPDAYPDLAALMADNSYEGRCLLSDATKVLQRLYCEKYLPAQEFYRDQSEQLTKGVKNKTYRVFKNLKAALDKWEVVMESSYVKKNKNFMEECEQLNIAKAYDRYFTVLAEKANYIGDLDLKRPIITEQDILGVLLQHLPQGHHLHEELSIWAENLKQFSEYRLPLSPISDDVLIILGRYLPKQSYACGSVESEAAYVNFWVNGLRSLVLFHAEDHVPENGYLIPKLQESLLAVTGLLHSQQRFIEIYNKKVPLQNGRQVALGKQILQLNQRPQGQAIGAEPAQSKVEVADEGPSSHDRRSPSAAVSNDLQSVVVEEPVDPDAMQEVVIMASGQDTAPERVILRRPENRRNAAECRNSFARGEGVHPEAVATSFADVDVASNPQSFLQRLQQQIGSQQTRDEGVTKPLLTGEP